MQDHNNISSDWREHPEAVVNDAVSTAMSKGDPNDSINALLSYIGQSMMADRSYIFEFADEGVLYNSYEWCSEGVTPQIGKLSHTPISLYTTTWLPRFQAHEPVIISDMDAYAQEDPEVAGVLRPQDIESLVAIPLFLEGRFVGFIGIDNPARDAMEGAAAFLETLASVVSALLRHRDNVQRLYRLSTHDRVSGSLDTLYLLELLEQARKTGVVAPTSGPDLSDVGDVNAISVCYCNLVQFKEFNEGFGIEEGNRCLADVARTLEEAFGTHCVSRFSADHFVVFYGGADIWERVDAAHEAVLRVRDNFKLWLNIGVCAPEADRSLSTAVDLAKVACDQIPKDGQSYRCLYSGKIEDELERKKYLQDHIDQAVSQGWVQVYYQPVIRGLTGRLAGAEALSRWHDPVYGEVSPGIFVPALEEKHLSWKLLEYVIEQACSRLSERYRQGFPVVPVSVNVSRTDFESCHPFDIIQDAVTRHDIPASLICVEITESVAMSDPEGIEAIVERFHQAGYEVWMDDFGSAYSSLNTLKNFSFGKLKLDMLFMHNFNERAKIIVESIIGMAKRLGIHTLAEGVETREQVNFLIDVGCEEIQGFYFSKPLSFDEILDYAQSVPSETHEQRLLYNELGLVRLYENGMCGFVFYKDGVAHALYGNAHLRNQLKRNGIDTPGHVDALLNSTEGRFSQTFHALAKRALESGMTETLPFSYKGHHFQLSVQVAAQNTAGVVLMTVLLDIADPETSLGMTGDDARRMRHEDIADWAPMLLRNEQGAEGPGTVGSPESDSGADALSLLDLRLGSKAIDELQRGFSVPSTSVAATSLAIRHSEGDALETFTALSSIFITLVNADFTTWAVQPIKIARVTEDYLSGEYVDYRTVAKKFLEQSVAESYREPLRRFMDPNTVVDRLSKYGTVTLDYIGAKLGWCRLFLIPIATNDEGRVTKALFAARDINAEKAEERRMNYGIMHDPLTKALNRNGLRQAIDLIGGYRGTVAYVMVDVDNFKELNDSFGHEMGDELLIRVADLLVDAFGATDYVARIGGDEFVVLLGHYERDEDGTAICERIEQINHDLAAGLDESLEEKGLDRGVAVSLSAGIVISHDGYRDDLYHLADQALYEVKASGKGTSSVRVVGDTES